VLSAKSLTTCALHQVTGEEINNEEMKNFSKFQLGILEENIWETRPKHKWEVNAKIKIYGVRV
jgi:hypothetical protein